MPRKNKPGAGRPTTPGERHNIKLPAHVWAYLLQTGNASRTITKLVEDEMGTWTGVDNRLRELGFNDEERDIIIGWWAPREHYDWLMSASKEEILEASEPAFER